MIKIYTAPSCLSCRKVKRYFTKHNIPFVEKNILHTKLTKENIFRMLINSENGFEDIISLRSKAFKEATIDIETMKINELVDFIIENPTILKRPIIVTDDEIQVGYNDDDITLFLPPELRDSDSNFSLEQEDWDYGKSLKVEYKK